MVPLLQPSCYRDLVILLVISLTLTGQTVADNFSANTLSEAERRVKTVFGILRYTQWSTTHNAQVSLCLLGEHPNFASMMHYDGQYILPHGDIRIRQLSLSTRSGLHGCAAVIIGEQPKITPAALVGARNLLVICDGCDQERFLPSIVLREEGSRVGFDVFLQRARDKGLRFDAPMLEMALTVEVESD